MVLSCPLHTLLSACFQELFEATTAAVDPSLPWSMAFDTAVAACKACVQSKVDGGASVQQVVEAAGHGLHSVGLLPQHVHSSLVWAMATPDVVSTVEGVCLWKGCVADNTPFTLVQVTRTRVLASIVAWSLPQPHLSAVKELASLLAPSLAGRSFTEQ